MDKIQKKLIKMLKDNPSCIDDRKTLRAMLLDCLPQDKLQQNLILNAYDEDIVDRLQPSSDATLHALQMVNVLTDGYGLTKESALWAVVSWCHMLGLGEIADIIATMIPAESADSSATNKAPKPQSANGGFRTEIGLGRYAAGYDIPEGVITVSPIERIKKGQIRVWVINGKKKDLIADVKDSFTVELKKGEYLETELVYSGNLSHPDYQFSVSKR